MLTPPEVLPSPAGRTPPTAPVASPSIHLVRPPTPAVRPQRRAGHRAAGTGPGCGNALLDGWPWFLGWGAGGFRVRQAGPVEHGFLRLRNPPLVVGVRVPISRCAIGVGPASGELPSIPAGPVHRPTTGSTHSSGAATGPERGERARQKPRWAPPAWRWSW